jgi:hypothetical protein
MAKKGEHSKPYPHKQSTIAATEKSSLLLRFIAMNSLQSNLEGDEQRVRCRTSGVVRNLLFGGRISGR